jgi:hypothetical protein
MIIQLKVTGAATKQIASVVLHRPQLYASFYVRVYTAVSCALLTVTFAVLATTLVCVTLTKLVTFGSCVAIVDGASGCLTYCAVLSDLPVNRAPAAAAAAMRMVKVAMARVMMTGLRRKNEGLSGWGGRNLGKGFGLSSMSSSSLKILGEGRGLWGL